MFLPCVFALFPFSAEAIAKTASFALLGHMNRGGVRKNNNLGSANNLKYSAVVLISSSPYRSLYIVYTHVIQGGKRDTLSVVTAMRIGFIKVGQIKD